MTPLPFGVTVYSGCMICSKIQIDSLSNTVVLFIDCESAVRAITRLPPCTGAPALPPELDGLELEPEPQAARTVRAPTAIRARAAVVRYVTATPLGIVGAGQHLKQDKPLFLANMLGNEPDVNSGGDPGTQPLRRCNLSRRALCRNRLRCGGRHGGRRAGP